MLDDVDRAALERSLALLPKLDPSSVQQIESKLEDEPWEEVARFASYCCQRRTLRLKPWESPPCSAGTEPEEGDSDSDRAATRLLNRLLEAGLSQFEPDPQGALEEGVRQMRRAEPPAAET